MCDGTIFPCWVERNVGFVGMVVARMVPPPSDRFGIEDQLFVVADSYHKLPFDGKNVKGDIPDIKGMEPAKKAFYA